MDHSEALRLQAAEKYVLGELPKAQLEEYEEHYFDCPACAEEIKATVAFMESSRQVAHEAREAREEGFKRVPASEASRSNRGWLVWLRPAFAIPVFAALLLFIGYQNEVTIPRLKQSSSQSAQVIGSSLNLTGSVRGGSDSADAVTKLQVRRGESFLLDFDFTPARTFNAYHWQLEDQTGHAVSQGTLSGDKTNQAVRLAVLGGVDRAGKYNLVFFGGADGTTQAAAENEVQRFTFTVEFLH